MFYGVHHCYFLYFKLSAVNFDVAGNVLEKSFPKKNVDVLEFFFLK